MLSLYKTAPCREIKISLSSTTCSTFALAQTPLEFRSPDSHCAVFYPKFLLSASRLFPMDRAT